MVSMLGNIHLCWWTSAVLNRSPGGWPLQSCHLLASQETASLGKKMPQQNHQKWGKNSNCYVWKKICPSSRHKKCCQGLTKEFSKITKESITLVIHEWEWSGWAKLPCCEPACYEFNQDVCWSTEHVSIGSSADSKSSPVSWIKSD